LFPEERWATSVRKEQKNTKEGAEKGITTLLEISFCQFQLVLACLFLTSHFGAHNGPRQPVIQFLMMNGGGKKK